MNPEEFAPNTQQQEALYEALGNLTPLSGTFTFTQYTKQQLSQDGYVFWVKGSKTTTVEGALHIATDREQEMDDTIAMNSVILDAQSEITEFNQVSPTTMWVGEVSAPDGQTIQIAFQRRGPFFANAGVYHYAGYAVFPPFGPQLVASTADLPTGPIVSNSLPLWLAFSSSSLPLYPSFLVPENAAPPYIAVHIPPDLTQQLQPVPLLMWSETTPDPNKSGFYDLTTYQLMRDRIELIAYGLTNVEIWQFIYQLLSDMSDSFGFVTTPTIRDDKRTQPEIMAIAMKKTVEFDASYYMTAADAAARRLITSAAVTYTTSN